jgi:hypothetical protein
MEIEVKGKERAVQDQYQDKYEEQAHSIRL